MIKRICVAISLLVSAQVAFSQMMIEAVAETAVLPEMTLYKDQYCGCCVAYEKYLEAHGAKITSINHPDMREIKMKYGTYKGASCHTMIVGDFVVEGHVPIASIQKMLAEKPDIKGIALPGMPPTSPGMGEEVKGSLRIMAIEHSSDIKNLFNQE